MPLLLCPNDNAGMQTVQRSGVEFDICPTCRGVWLDRGELEKLMAAGRDDEDRPPTERRAVGERPQVREDYRDRRDWDDDDDHHRRRKRRGLDIFDIFD